MFPHSPNDLAAAITSNLEPGHLSHRKRSQISAESRIERSEGSITGRRLAPNIRVRLNSRTVDLTNARPSKLNVCP